MKKTFCLLIAALAAACGADATTGRRVRLRTRLSSDAAPGVPFTTGLGWTVTLTRAAVATGPLYYFEGKPAFVEGTGPARRRLAWLWPVSVAHAHPGHYGSGRAMGQVLAPFSADLLAEPTILPDGEGISGLYRSASFSFAAPSAGPGLAALGAHVAVATGTATKEGKTVHFSLAADAAEITRTAKDALVSGCPLAEANVQDDGTITVTVSPRVWFGLVDFADTAPGTPDAPTIIEPGATARIAFALGLAQLNAYHFAYAPSP